MEVALSNFRWPAKMKAKTIHIDITFNDGSEERRATLSGFAYVDAGFLAGLIRPAGRSMLSLKDQVMLTAFTFTGCPIAARTSKIGLNPWLLTNGSYSATRRLVGELFQVNSSIVAKGTVDSVDMRLKVECLGILPDIVAVEA